MAGIWPSFWEAKGLLRSPKVDEFKNYAFTIEINICWFLGSGEDGTDFNIGPELLMKTLAHHWPRFPITLAVGAGILPFVSASLSFLVTVNGRCKLLTCGVTRFCRSIRISIGSKCALLLSPLNS